jgi:salicylate hydroxylase
MRIPTGSADLTPRAAPVATRPSLEKLHAIVAGAGIGGLTAALALARAGLRVTVLERAPVVEESGAGLQLSPNCSRILRQYGVLDRLLGQALMPEALHIRNARDGAVLMRMPLGVIAEMRWGAPYLLVLRRDLQRALIEAIAREPSVILETDTHVVGYAASSEGVEVGAKRGEESLRLESDLLIGADGLHSLVRERIGLGFADVPIYSGYIAWRALVEAAEAPPEALRLETSLWLGPKAHLVHYPLRGGSVVNIVAVTEDSWRGAETGDFWSTPGDAADLAARLGRWDGEARAIIGAVREWRRWPLFDRHPVPRWTVPRVALLGDAAHPLLPFLAQGAAQAIEDAHALGRAFADHGEIAASLAAYERERTARAAAVQVASRRQGQIYHLAQPAAQLRNLGMRMLGAAGMLARYDWLYQYRS